MSSTRKQPLKLNLPHDVKVRTTDDVAYQWRTYGQHTGWSRTFRPDRQPQLPTLLIPKDFERELASALLNSEPKDLAGTDLAGAIYLAGNKDHPHTIDQLQELRNRRIAGEGIDNNDVSLSRAHPEEIKALYEESRDATILARAFRLKSLPARDRLIELLDKDVVTQVLNNHPELPAEITSQIKRSPGYAPLRVVPDDLPTLAGNPNLPSRAQTALVNLLLVASLDGDKESETALSRALSAGTLPEDAAWIAIQYNPLPRTAALALAKNKDADWNWLRTALDAHPEPDVALASLEVGERTTARIARLANHPDPVVRSRVESHEEPGTWSWFNKKHLTVLQAIDDPITYLDWTQQPEDIEPDTWGAYSVSRHWVARAGEFPEAEKLLRRAVNLHNRSWGALGEGSGDPQKAARSEAERVVALSDPQLRLLGMNPAQKYTVDEARVLAVQATAARGIPDPSKEQDPITEAVLAACACEADRI